MAARVELIIESVDKASGNIKKVNAELEGVDKTTKKLSTTWTELRSKFDLILTGFRQLSAATKYAYDFIRAGAEIDFVYQKFDRLAVSIGTVSEALMTDLREATRGMYSDTELAASAMDFMSLGLAKSHDEVVRLSRVAGALNMNMNQLVLTLTNQTTMRFDALGVAVDGFDERLAKLKATGMDTNAAFTEAFLQQAEEQIRRTGEAADSSLGQMMMLESAFKNIGDNAKNSASNILFFTGTLEGMAEETNKIAFAVSRADEGFKSFTGVLARAIMEGGNNPVKILAAIVEETENITRWQTLYTRQTSEMTRGHQRAAEVTNQLAISNSVISTSYSDLLSLTKNLQTEEEKYSKTQDETLKKRNDIQKQIDELLKNGYGKESSQVKDLQGELDDLNQALDDNAQAHEDATRRIIFSMLEQKLAAEGMTQGEFDALLQLGVQWGILDQTVATEAASISRSIDNYLNTGDLQAYKQAMQGIIDMPASKVFEIMARFSISGNYNQVIAAIGGGSLPSSGTINTGGLIGQQAPAARAAGGPVSGGSTYLVGEQGPELFTPNSSGYITPNNAMGSMTVVFNYSPQISTADQAEAQERLMPFIERGIRQARIGV